MTSVEKDSNESEEKEGLELREALEVAIEATESTDGAVRDLVDAGISKSAREDAGRAERSEPPLEPPAEYNNEEKEDFRSLSRKGQEAQLRLHRSRQQTIEQIKADRRTLQEERQAVADERELVQRMRPFLKAMGGKFESEVALKKALMMWEEFESAPDPKKAAAEYLEAKGIPVPAELLTGSPEQPKRDPEVQRLREELNALTLERTRENQERFATSLHREWGIFESEKNGAGQPRFPDLNNNESGLRMAAQIGSLVGGQSEVSRQFIAQARNRIPDLNYQKLMHEAYRFLGGRVDDSEPPKSQSKTSHLARSQRAAASVPGGGGHRALSNGAKKLPMREALAAAIAERNGG